MKSPQVSLEIMQCKHHGPSPSEGLLVWELPRVWLPLS